MIIQRIKTIFKTVRIFRKIGLVDREKYRAYVNILSIIISKEDLIRKEAALISKIELSYQNRRNTVRIEVYFKDRKKYEIDLNLSDYVVPIEKQYTVDQVQQALHLIFGDNKTYGVKYYLYRRNKKASSL